MSFNDLKTFATLVVKNLSPSGNFWIIAPYSFVKLIRDNNLFKPLVINSLHVIHSKRNKLNSRVVIQFSFTATTHVIHEMTLRNDDNSYSREYINLTRQFHYNNLG